MRILNAGPGFSSPLSEQEIRDFLTNSKLNLHLGTLDEKQEPNIHPIWYYYDRLGDKLYVETSKASKKMSNVRKNNSVYFCVDEPNLPYRGVRGKGEARIHEDINFNVTISEKILVKYLGNLENPMAKQLLSYVKKRDSAILEIVPKYYSTWDNTKVE
jgi:nitroimidazol reductase NimA-like FMN-containing flavoprotein (pyridoxamine 5'-phosphate oxidase superfamily)